MYPINGIFARSLSIQSEEGVNPEYNQSTASAACIVNLLKDEYTKLITDNNVEWYPVRDRIILAPDSSEKINNIKGDCDRVVYIKDQSGNLPQNIEVYFICDTKRFNRFFELFEIARPQKPLLIVFNGYDSVEANQIITKNLHRMNKMLVAAIWLCYLGHPQLEKQILSYQAIELKEENVDLNRIIS